MMITPLVSFDHARPQRVIVDRLMVAQITWLRPAMATAADVVCSRLRQTDTTATQYMPRFSRMWQIRKIAM